MAKPSLKEAVSKGLVKARRPEPKAYTKVRYPNGYSEEKVIVTRMSGCNATCAQVQKCIDISSPVQQSIITVIANWFNTSNVDGISRFCEMAQDCIGANLQNMIYNDGANNWTVNVSATCAQVASCISSTPAVQTAINTLVNTNLSSYANFCPSVVSCIGSASGTSAVLNAVNNNLNLLTNLCTAVANCLTTGGIPSGIPLFTLNNEAVAVGDIITLESQEIPYAGLVVGTDDVKEAIDSLQTQLTNANTNLCANITSCINTNGLPVGTDLFTLDGNVIEVGDFVNTTVSVSAPGGAVLRVSVNGVQSQLNLTSIIQAGETTTNITNTQAGHRIATYTNEDVVAFDVNETVTSLGTPTFVSNILTIPFNNENGIAQTVTVDLGSIAPINDIQISNATYAAATNIITITETNGDVYTIDLSEFSITTNTLPNGDVQIIQEGVVKATVPGTASSVINVPAGNLAATNVQDALNELQSDIDTLTSGGAFTVSDTVTVDLTKTGNDIKADVIVSPDACNQLSALANGLYVAPNTVFETSTANWAADLLAIPGGTYLKNNDNGDFVYKKCDGTIVWITRNIQELPWTAIATSASNATLYTPGDTPDNSLGGYDYYNNLQSYTVPLPTITLLPTQKLQLEVRTTSVFESSNFINDGQVILDISATSQLGSAEKRQFIGKEYNIQTITTALIIDNGQNIFNIRQFYVVRSGLTPSLSNINTSYSSTVYKWSVTSI